MVKIKSMKLGLKGDPSSFKDVKMSQKWVESKGKVKFFQGLNKPALENLDPPIRPAKVVSRLKHNVTLSYMGQGMIVSPSARTMVNDYEKLGAIPSGITVIPMKK